MDSYMPRGIDAFTNVVLVTKDGTKLETHASHLITSCAALAAVPELFENATKSHPVELQEPFSSYETRTVVDFLACIYAHGGKVPDKSFGLDVIKLAHVLDASFLDAVRDALPSSLRPKTIHEINDIIDVASLCGWDDVKNAGISRLIWDLEAQMMRPPFPRVRFASDPAENASYSTETMATRPFEFSNKLLSTYVHLDSRAVAQKIVDVCSPGTVTSVLQAFASAKRLRDLRDANCDPPRFPLAYERIEYDHVVSDYVNGFIPCIDRKVPSQMIVGRIGATYDHHTCSIDGDADAMEMAIVAVFEIAALETGSTSMQFAVGSSGVRVSIRGEMVDDGIASFSLVGQCESYRFKVSYTLVVPGRENASCTGTYIVGPGGQSETDVNVRIDVSSGGPNVPVVCTIHDMHGVVK